MAKNKLFVLMPILMFLATSLACQLIGSQTTPAGQASTPSAGAESGSTSATPVGRASIPTAEAENGGASATPANQASAPILREGGGEGGTTAFSATGTGTPQGGSAPVLGHNAGESAVQPANVNAEPVKVVQVLREIMSGWNGYGKLLVVENPNPDVAIQDTQCQITAYDGSGAVLETNECGIGLLFPGERRTIYVGVMMSPSTPVAKLEFLITRQGKPVKTDLTSTSLVAERAINWPDEGVTTGIVKNSSNYLINMPILTAVLYDEQGQVIGVGKESFIGFIPPKGQAGVSLSTPRDVKPARVDIFVVPQEAWTIKPIAGSPPTIQVVQTQGFQDQGQGLADAVFIATNPNPDRSITLLRFQVAAYDAQGFVLGAGVGSTPAIFPGERVAIEAGQFHIPRGSSVATVQVQVSPLVEKTNLWDYRALGMEKNPLSAEQSQDQAQNSKVTCVLKNAWKNPIGSATVMAVAFDAGGKIQGYGSTGVFQVPAGGQTNATISMHVATGYNDAPARIDLFAYVTNPTEIR